jgi:hypothetical protein
MQRWFDAREHFLVATLRRCFILFSPIHFILFPDGIFVWQSTSTALNKTEI